MFVYLLATFCLSASTCESAIVASSEQDPRLTMTSCTALGQAAIAEFMGNSLKFRNWELTSFHCVEGTRQTAG